MSFENTKIGPRRDHYFRANALARAPLGARVGEVDFAAWRSGNFEVITKSS